MISAGRAAITMVLTDTQFFKDLEGAIDGVRREIQSLAMATAAVGAGITASLAAAAAKAQADAVKFRSIEMVLGESAQQATALASAIHGDVGGAVSDLTKKIAEFASESQSIGFTTEQALQLSNAIVRLGADLDAYYGKSGSADILQQALSGSASAAQQLGLDLSDAAVAAEFGRPIDEMTELQKAATRAAMAQKQLQDAGVTGAAQADTYSTSMSRLMQSVDNLISAIGRGMAPIYEFGRSALGAVFDAAAEGVNIIASLADRFPILTQVLGAAAIAMTAMGAAVAVVTSKIVVFTATHYAASWAVKRSVAALSTWSVTAPIVSGVTTVCSAAMTLLSAAAWSVAAAIGAALAPILAIGAAVVAAGAGLYFLHQKTGILTPVLKGLGAVGEFLVGVWNRVTGAIGKAVSVLLRLVGIKGGPKVSTQGVSGSPQLSGSQKSERWQAGELTSFAEGLRDSLKTPKEKFDELVAKLNEAASRGLVTPEEFEAMFDQAKKDLDEALRIEWENSEAGKRDKMLADFGKQLESETKTLEEQVAEKLSMINEALSAGKISPEVAARAVAAANQTLADHQAKVAEDIAKTQEQARQKVLDEINKAADTKLAIARARGGEEGEAAERQIASQRVRDLRANGFGEEAQKEEIALLGSIIQASQSVMDKAKDQRETMSSRSAQEAMFGRTGANIDEQQLEEQKRAVQEQREAKEALNRIVTALEG